jgi:hypothetical protein
MGWPQTPQPAPNGPPVHEWEMVAADRGSELVPIVPPQRNRPVPHTLQPRHARNRVGSYS